MYIDVDQDMAPHRLANDIVAGLGPQVALATMRAIATRLGAGDLGGVHKLERAIEQFDAVRHVGDLNLPRWEVQNAISNLEYLRNVGLALGELISRQRRARGSSAA